jgi:hypothetical protein
MKDEIEKELKTYKRLKIKKYKLKNEDRHSNMQS